MSSRGKRPRLTGVSLPRHCTESQTFSYLFDAGVDVGYSMLLPHWSLKKLLDLKAIPDDTCFEWASSASYWKWHKGFMAYQNVNGKGRRDRYEWRKVYGWWTEEWCDDTFFFYCRFDGRIVRVSDSFVNCKLNSALQYGNKERWR